MTDDNQKHKLHSSISSGIHDKHESSMYVGSNATSYIIDDSEANPNANLTSNTGIVSIKTKENQTSNFSHVEIDVSGDEIIQISSDSLGRGQHQICLYIVCYSKPKDKFKIQALFPSDLKFDFEQSNALHGDNNYFPYVHYLTLDVTSTNTNNFAMLYNARSYTVNDYSLRISWSNFTGKKHFPHGIKRSLSDCPPTWHHFLFNIEFSNLGSTKAPGSTVDIWRQFCLFTFFIMQRKDYTTFNTLLDQFQALLANKKIPFMHETFDAFFIECFSCIPIVRILCPDKHMALKDLLRMLGLLNIHQNNINLTSSHARQFLNEILLEVNKCYDSIVTSVTSDEWDLFRNGLSNIICLQLLFQTCIDDDPMKNSCSTLALLKRISNQTQREDVANTVLKQMENFSSAISTFHWAELLTLVNPNSIRLKHVEFNHSFETYFTYIAKFPEVLAVDGHFQQNLARHFDGLILNNHFSINLPSIRFLLQLVTNYSAVFEGKDEKTCRIIRSAIDVSGPLREKITSYFLTLNVNIEDLLSIREILQFHNTSLLYNVDKEKFLAKSLTNSDVVRSADFYLEWFSYFMAYNIQEHQIHIVDDTSFKKLIKVWLDSLAHDQQIFVQIFKAFDRLSSMFIPQENNTRLTYWIENTIDLFFQKDNLYDLIDPCVLHIQNAIFIEQFKLKFQTNILRPMQNNANKKQNSQIHIIRLSELDKMRGGNNQLLRDLISLVAQFIQITKDDILQDTFEQPNRSSFIYKLLFEEWAQTLTIHQNLVDQLIAQLITWKEQGLRSEEIARWKNYSDDEREVVYKIWSFTCQRADRTFELDRFIEDEDEKMKAKLRLKDDITLCLSSYCKNACDQQIYFQQLEDMDKKFGNQIVRSIDIPDGISELVSYITRLKVFSESTAWLKFYKERCEYSTVNVSDEQLITLDDKIEDRLTCSALLLQAGQIFESFVDELKSICDTWKTSPISRLIQLFPESNYIDHDLQMLEPLLNNANVIPILKKILDYWKSHEHLRHVCQGFINLITRLQLPNISHPVTLVRMLEINDDALGEVVYQTYQDFCEQYSMRYPSKVLHIIAHYSSSNELMKFLHQLSANDANNLLEAVNDWDESLINTKIVLDFILIKTFHDRIYFQLESIVKEQSISDLDQVISCFQSVLDENEFQNILLCFESCSRLLYSIQQVHLDLTDKEQSKRQRILEIMQKSSFTFVNKSTGTLDSAEYLFDVNTDIQSTTYTDLSELRDRARLIEHASHEINRNSKEEIDDLLLFISLVDLIEVVLKRLTLLYISGHPYVSDPYAPSEEFQCVAKNYEALETFSKRLEGLLDTWNNYLCEIYKECLDLTYFFFHQLWSVEYYLNDQNTRSKNAPGYHLLKFLNLEPDSLEINSCSGQDQKPKRRLHGISQTLNTHRQYRYTNMDIRVKLIKNVILTETSEEGVMRAILSFFELTQVQGKVKQLLYCTENTSWFEVRGFIYRCFYSQTLQQLIRPELLTSLIQGQVIELIRELIKSSLEHYFQLAIITTVSTIHTQLIHGLKVLDIVHMYHDQDLLDQSKLKHVIEQYVGNNIAVVTSRIAGLGKSTFIRDSIVQANKQYIKFPINGDIYIDKIAEQLSNYGDKLGTSKCALHLDIGMVDNIRQLNEFLYCLLLFRNFRLDQVAVHIPADVPIYIELDASPDATNLYQKILIFKYLKEIHIDHINWNEMKPQNLPGIQWVVNYLDAIEKQTINNSDINETSIRQLDNNTSCHLLQKYILQDKNDEFITWTKVSIFIAVYSKLFSGFSRCGHFLVDSVKWLGVPQLRTDILLSLLKSSDQFTSLSVEAVRKNQRSVNNHALVDYTEAIIRWDKSQAFTLVFTATDDPVFVYKRTEDVPISLTAALSSRVRTTQRRNIFRTSSQYISQPILLSDYTNLTHAQFFAKLASLSRKYFNKSICLKCFRQYEYTEQQCQKCSTHDILVRPHSWNNEDIIKFQHMIADKLQEEYVLTPDNYVKMLLIYLRVQSDLPVLIMGETGQ